MKKIYLKLLVIVTVTLLVNGREAFNAAAAIPPQQGGNLLQNPSFERPYNNDGAAEHWVRWHRESGEDQFDDCANGYHKRPRWGDATDFVQDGSVSQYVGNNWDTWAGGVWQTVSVTPGSTYRFSFYARGRGAMQGAPEPSDSSLNMNIRAGIDPNGSGLWSDGDVVWGAAGSPHDEWQLFSVEATATGDQVTVFTAADWGVPGVNQCRRFLDTYFDGAQLVEVGPPPTATSPPQPTAPLPPPATATPLPPTETPTPAVTPTDTPVPTDTPSPTPAGGTICINAFVDENADGLHDANEGYMAGVTFTVADEQEVINQAVSPGGEEPVCFEGLSSGTYQIAQILPGRLEPTTATNTSLEVEEGKVYGIEFGSRIDTGESGGSNGAGSDEVAVNLEIPTVPPETEATPQEGGGFNLASYTGLLLIVLAVIVLGGILYFWLRRQTSG